MSTQRLEHFGWGQGQLTLNVLWLTGYDGTPVWCERCHDGPAWIVVVGEQQELLCFTCFGETVTVRTGPPA